MKKQLLTKLLKQMVDVSFNTGYKGYEVSLTTDNKSEDVVTKIGDPDETWETNPEEIPVPEEIPIETPAPIEVPTSPPEREREKVPV